MPSRSVVRPLVIGLLAVGLLFLVGRRYGPVPPLGVVLDPVDGFFRTARHATFPPAATAAIPGLDQPVRVVRDGRGVPHIFASSDPDAVAAMGYVVAQDRLFQMDLIVRGASGRLAEALGPGLVAVDRYQRAIGMPWGARRNYEAIQAAGGEELELFAWFARGVNAYVDGLEADDLPFEFRLLGYAPKRFEPIDVLHVLQYMAYDLSFRSDYEAYHRLAQRLSPEAFAQLYPGRQWPLVPIIPNEEAEADARTRAVLGGLGGSAWTGAMPGAPWPGRPHAALEGWQAGKGSNNWAVAPARSTTRGALLAGDMHLGLTMPAIWYEVHLATPAMNVYGVTVPGAPAPIVGFNDRIAWTPTNTAADQLDAYRLELDEAGTHYRYEGDWRPLTLVSDTILVRGAAPVVDTLRYSHWGPVRIDEAGVATAIRWTAHDENRTGRAIWGMVHARNLEQFEEALAYWGAPMQNMLYADVTGTIAIRSAGHLPIRNPQGGAAGAGPLGVLDGTTAAGAWQGRVPFDELPYARDPASGFLTSTNQQPADTTYPYYLGADWRSTFRPIRIDSLLRSRERHSVEDMMRYQADVYVQQLPFLRPLIAEAAGLSPRADSLRAMLLGWDGAAAVDRPEPLVFDEWLQALEALAWDEAAFEGVRKPALAQLIRLLQGDPSSRWLDVQGTPAQEDAGALVAQAFEQAADALADAYGWSPEAWRWGDHHTLLIPHMTRSAALGALGRGPVPYPGYRETLSPARGRTVGHSASWRMVVDLGQQPPQGFGVYPGGQSGNPFSSLYDLHLPAYLTFEHYELLKPSTPEALEAEASSVLELRPAAP